MADQESAVVDVSGLTTGYGSKDVLKGINLHVQPGEVVAVIGHNGAGKSTLLKAMFGLLPLWQGAVEYAPVVTRRVRPRDLINGGVVYLPQDRQVFVDLSVLENIELGSIGCDDKGEVERRVQLALEQFPSLKERLRQEAGTLSGGEKQMVALARGFVRSPKLMLLDEPSLGLAPGLVKSTLRVLTETSREVGSAVLIVEQKVREVLAIAERVYVLSNGRVSFSGAASSLQDESKLREVYL